MSDTKSLQKSFLESSSLEVEVLKLRKENKALHETVSKLCRELDTSRGIEKVPSKLILTPEEEILSVQISQLNGVSRERKLTLEEVKTLDLLIKNKRLLNKQRTSNNNLTLPENLSDEELMRIAEHVEDQPESSE